ncbi:hypothetical protein DJ021_07620 [Phenylobacterium hankyongense]|uniref:Uncharacterized protein n=1 Tax=Phenylobacterium hankyongense TaxID=1813876 RepID=A0A328B3U3_9CAUL|nr:hypothetical protein [Phenylobacterium hankyongense]RAK59678.1 hypothetical protein DJ021_07620 [Phenylobacterium hankyongense]
MKPKVVVPWHYLVMLVLGVAVLALLLWRFGRTDKVLIGWLIGWLVLSRLVDTVYRRRRRRLAAQTNPGAQTKTGEADGSPRNSQD